MTLIFDLSPLKDVGIWHFMWSVILLNVVRFSVFTCSAFNSWAWHHLVWAL